MMTGAWSAQRNGEDDTERRVSRIVAGVVRLASDDEACRILGVDGTLEDELDLTFLDDPLAWIASEIAGALQETGIDAGEEMGVELDEDDLLDTATQVSLSTVVALARLYRILLGGTLDERELRAAVLRYLEDELDEEDV